MRNIPRVRGESAEAALSRLIARVSGSTSTKTGTSPSWTKGHTVVGQASAGTRTSSPGDQGASPRERRSITSTASRLADDPELTITAWRAPVHVANAASNASSRSPNVRRPDSSAAFAALISSSSKVFAASE
jgi:hypothetical protein